MSKMKNETQTFLSRNVSKESLKSRNKYFSNDKDESPGPNVYNYDTSYGGMAKRASFSLIRNIPSVVFSKTRLEDNKKVLVMGLL